MNHLQSQSKSIGPNMKVLALDLERTLIDNALHGRPRPGLLEFLTFCHENFARIVLFTTVEETDACAVLDDLNSAGHLPSGFLDVIEYVDWRGEYKDLTLIKDASPHDVL